MEAEVELEVKVEVEVEVLCHVGACKTHHQCHGSEGIPAYSCVCDFSPCTCSQPNVAAIARLPAAAASAAFEAPPPFIAGERSSLYQQIICSP